MGIARRHSLSEGLRGRKWLLIELLWFQEKFFFENLLFEEKFFGESGCLKSDNGHDRACEEVSWDHPDSEQVGSADSSQPGGAHCSQGHCCQVSIFWDPPLIQ